MKFVLLPFISWISCGCLKFLINYVRAGFDYRAAKNLIGYGGFPSTHTTITSSAMFAVGFEYGFETPIFSLALAVLIVVIMDAHGLRRNVGLHAERLNQLEDFSNESKLRERMGHTYFEISGGLILGLLLAYIFKTL